MRPRDSREKVSPHPPYLRNKTPTELKIGIQRVVVVLPVEEQSQEVKPSEEAVLNSTDDSSFQGFDDQDINPQLEMRAKLDSLIKDQL